eukprot:2268535-Prymnesium_polylepis.1
MSLGRHGPPRLRARKLKPCSHRSNRPSVRRTLPGAGARATRTRAFSGSRRPRAGAAMLPCPSASCKGHRRPA